MVLWLWEIALLEPAIGDLSDTAEEWWSEVMAAVQRWYSDHMLMSPLERTAHRPTTPGHLQQKRWQRLERRVASMLIKAIPDTQKEELVASKSLGVFGIMCHLQILYQPGGLGEKETILRNLESPPEAQGLQDAVTLLRRWSRWKVRAKDIGVAEPDPSVLLRGLSKLVKKVLEMNGELRFRVSLARSTLMLDSAPNPQSVERFCTLLLAEIEQVAHTDKVDRRAAPKPKVNEFKAKKDEEDDGEKKGKGKGSGDAKNLVCKYFLTEEGCRKGKDCGFAHQMDNEKRCWVCGCKSHFANACTRPQGGGKASGKAMKVLQKGGEKDLKLASPGSSAGSEKAPSEAPDVSSGTSVQAVASEDSMKQILEEAQKMLRSMNAAKEEPRGSDGRIQALQKQLDDLRRVSIKVFRISRIKKEEGAMGLLDSGATHALRPPTGDEKLELMPDVAVTLAGGREVTMKLGKGGSIVGDGQTEPIVPLGLLTKTLKCRLVWSNEGVKLIHPVRGPIKVQVIDGCPMIDHSTALQLIGEIERLQWGKPRLTSLNAQEEPWKKVWLEKIVEEHPALQDLPLHIKKALKVEPCEYLKSLGNRRKRRLWKREGVVLHLYSGEKDGYTLSRALKEVGGDPRRLIELDVQHGGEHSDLGCKGLGYAMCLHLAFEGMIKAVISGPPCKTRSVLRHLEVPGVPDMPRPLREWGGGEFGKEDLKKAERDQVEEDDVLMFRAWTVWILAEEVRKLEGKREQVGFGMEQPAIPSLEEVVTIWRTPQWLKMKEAYGFKLQSFNQGDFGGTAKKPTGWGGNLPIDLPEPLGGGKARDVKGKTKEEILTESRSLARWAPGLMRAVAIELQDKVYRGKVVIKKLSWQEHLNANHFPFRRDCRVCQEACARDQHHRRSKLPPRAGVLSLDMAGPFKPAPDLRRGTKAKYFLAATFTWPDALQDGSPEEKHEDPGCSDDAPWIEVEDAPAQPEGKRRKGRPSKLELNEEKRKKEVEEDRKIEEEKRRKEEAEELERELEEEGIGDTPRPDLDLDFDYSPSIGPEDEHQEDSGEKKEEEGQAERQEPRIKFFRLITPLPSRDHGEVMKAIVDTYLRLRSAGMEVQQIHSDNAGEFVSRPLRQWCLQRGILQTYTPGDQPKCNGRAEQTVGELKSRIRRMLLAAGAPAERWAHAARCLSETLWIQALDQKKKCPSFMSEVLVRKRHWKAEDLLPIQEKVTYLAPSWLHHGHWIERADGSRALTRLTMSELHEPIQDHHWIGIQEDPSPVEVRWRIREKASLRSVTVPEGEHPREPGGGEEGKKGEEKEKEYERQAWKVLEEEMTRAVTEDGDSLDVVLGALGRLRQMVIKEEEEILQTKIVSPGEVRRDVEAWSPAIQSELDSLCQKKEALAEIDEAEGKKLVQEGLAEVIPAKLVCTIKPDPLNRAGKKKIRIVGCGNYAAPDPDQDLFAAGTNAVAVRIALALAA